jgi:hypothetical protein
MNPTYVVIAEKVGHAYASYSLTETPDWPQPKEVDY